MIWLLIWVVASILLAPIAGHVFFKCGGGCSQLPSDEAPQLGAFPGIPASPTASPSFN